MKNQTIIVLKSENAAQEIFCPYCSTEQKTYITIIHAIIESNGNGHTTCICCNCKKEFEITSFNCIFFETRKLRKSKKEGQ